MGHGFGFQPSFNVGLGGSDPERERAIAEERQRRQAQAQAQQAIANVLSSQKDRMSQPLPGDTTFTKLDVTGAPQTAAPAGDFRFPEAQSFQSGPTQAEAIKQLQGMNLPPDVYATAINSLVGKLPQEPEQPASVTAKEQGALGQRFAAGTATPADVAAAEQRGLKVNRYDPDAQAKRAFLASADVSTPPARAEAINQAINRGWPDVAKDLQLGGAARREAKQETEADTLKKTGEAEAVKREAQIADLKQRGVKLTPEQEASAGAAIDALRSGDPKEMAVGRRYFLDFGQKMMAQAQTQQRIGISQRRAEIYERKANAVKAEKDHTKKQDTFLKTMAEGRQQIAIKLKEKRETSDPIRRAELDDEIAQINLIQADLTTHMREYGYGQGVTPPPGGPGPKPVAEPASVGGRDPSLDKYLNK